METNLNFLKSREKNLRLFNALMTSINLFLKLPFALSHEPQEIFLSVNMQGHFSCLSLEFNSNCLKSDKVKSLVDSLKIHVDFYHFFKFG